jgi:hypothetical protein
MTQVYFHYTSPEKAFIDGRGAEVDDLVEARDRATSVVRSLVEGRGLEDWRSWVMHVNDELGEELFVVPFAFVLGKPH